MRANTWQGKNKLEVIDVPDPQLLNRRDAIVKISSTAICGSDLHLYNGFMPSMREGDVLGHEFMGEITDVGPDVDNLKVGDRVVVPFPIACGSCSQCRRGMFSVCENSNPNAGMFEQIAGQSLAGIFGYSHLTGGFAGGQAEAARVPFADVGPIKIESDLTDEQVLFLSDVFPTGYMGAELCDPQPGDVIAVWGAGPVGLFAAVSALLLGASRVIVIDRFEYRLQLAREKANCETVNYMEMGDGLVDVLREMTGGRGPDKVIDAVGMESHDYHGIIHTLDRVKQSQKLATERGSALRQAILACRPGGVVSVVGAYGGLMDKVPMGAFLNKSLTIKGGQCHVHRYLKPLLGLIEKGDIDPTFIITHTLPLEEAPAGFEAMKQKEDECVKCVLKP
jgi:threonine dehydrogenase-like Zn-dependent dehydrogenase